MWKFYIMLSSLIKKGSAMVLQVPLLSLFLTLIPEGILLILGNYVITKTEINIKKILISGFLLGISAYMIRLTRIPFGLHLVFNLILSILISIFINNISFSKAIYSSFSGLLILSALDMLITSIYLNFLGIDFKSLDSLLQNPFSRALFSLPSLITFLVFILILYIRNHQNTYKKEKGV